MEQEKDCFIALSFNNGRYVEIEIPKDSFEKEKEEIKKDFLGELNLKVLDNIIFRMKDLAFIAFYERNKPAAVAVKGESELVDVTPDSKPNDKAQENKD